ncbi:hypothetical protein GCM10009601_00770 [Streptomyces thermospinosisporus]|uniref:DUF4232 domain-containing protein n=1 Tax=Streptomyces thermospinosisporus TaxID=161482 RepID=A0ABN1YJ62_9ACTN
MNITARRTRTHRTTGRRACALAAGVLAALLTTTACQPGSADGAGGPEPATSAAKSGEPGAAKTDGAGADQGAGKPDGATGSQGAADRKVPDCTPEHLAVSAVQEPADSKEARHLLVTVQNTGDTRCNLHRYPHLRLGADAQSTVPVIEDSAPDPGKPVTLARGAEAYAALLVSGGGRDEYEAESLGLTLQGPKQGTAIGKPVDVPLPAKPLYADDGQLVTYWTTASGAALDFIMSR